MNRIEALISSIERDLSRFHRDRMSKLQGRTYAALRNERAKPDPSGEAIRRIQAEMVEIERNKLDESITVREVLNPLRQRRERERGLQPSS